MVALTIYSSFYKFWADALLARPRPCPGDLVGLRVTGAAVSAAATAALLRPIGATASAAATAALL